MNMQLFITAIEAEAFSTVKWDDTHIFGIDHGVINNML
jgi:hypothetical protein